MPDGATLRFGLVGTGYWARETHARRYRRRPGRHPGRRVGPRPCGRLRARGRVWRGRVWRGRHVHGLRRASWRRSTPSRSRFRPTCSRPSRFGPRQAGKHLLLEKPMALDEAERRPGRGGRGVQRRGGPGLLHPPVLAARRGPGSRRSTPTRGSAARRMLAGLGAHRRQPVQHPVASPSTAGCGTLDRTPSWTSGGRSARWCGSVAEPGAPDVTHLVLHHESGASSTSTLTLSAPDAADGFTMMLWGPRGRTGCPIDDVDSMTALTVAAEELCGHGPDRPARPPGERAHGTRRPAGPARRPAPARRGSRGREVAGHRLPAGAHRRARGDRRPRARGRRGPVPRAVVPGQHRAPRASAWTARSTRTRSGRSGSSTRSRPATA